MPTENETLPPADAGPVERGVGRLEPKRTETPLGVHWFGGRPYMLTSAAPTTRIQKMREAGFTRRPSAKSLPSDE